MAAAFDPATLDWNLLRVFVEVLDQGSLSAAARRLGSSQPTLSRQVAALEATLGAPLFERSARRLRPTAMALALAEPARRMLAAATACAHAAADSSDAIAGTVRLTASQVVSAHVLPPLLAALRQAEPALQIELVASDELGNLLEREADIAVRMVRPTQGALITRHLGDWPLGFYLHRERLAALGGEVTLAGAPALPWIGLDQGRQMIDGFREAGFDIDRSFFGLRCDNQIVTFAALCAGAGIGIAMQPLAARQPQLVQVLRELPLPELPVWLTAHRELRASRRLQRVWDALAAGLPAWAAAAPAPAPPPAPRPAPAARRRVSARR